MSQMGFRRPDRALVASNPQQCMMNGCIEVKSYPTVVSAHSFKNAFRAGICQAIAYNLTTHELACGWIGALVYGTCFQRIMVISDSSDDVVIGIEVSETPSHPQWLMDTRAAPEDLLDTKAATGDLLDIKAATEDLLDTKAATGDLLDTKAATGDLLDRKAATEDPLNSPGSSSACPNAGVIGVCSFEDFIARAKNDNLAYRVAHDFVAGVDAQSTEPVRLDISAVLRYSHMLAVSAYDYAGVKLSELLPLSSARSVVNLPLHQAVLNRARELGQADDDRGDGEIAPGGNVDDLQDSGSATITPPDERCSAEAHELDDDLYPEDSISQAGSDTPDANVERALLLCKPVIALVTSSMMDALIAERIQAGAAA